MNRIILALGAVLCFSAASAYAEAPCVSRISDSLAGQLLRQAPGLKAEVLRMALRATGCAAEQGKVKRRDLLTVIDYSLPSSQPRLWVFDLESRKLLFRELVAHGKNSGGDLANFFSNASGSLATSLGLFVTGGTYFGSNGYSLRLKGLEEGVNDMAFERAIVMHGAPYVSRAAIKALGRLGRSWGCPAVRAEIAEKLIDAIRGGTAIFAYYPDQQWLASSAFFNRNESGGTQHAAAR